MAVTQKSKIQVRRGRRENLPQLSAGEFGWAVDTQQLFIGNGTFDEGAASEGNTEIVTVNNPLLVAVNNVFAVTTLLNNISSPTEILRLNINGFPFGAYNYSMTRGSNHRVGTFQFAYNATGSTIDVLDLTTGNDLGVVLSASLSGDFMILSYTSTNTGTNITFRYKRVDFQ